MKKLWNWVCSLFASEKVGIIWRAIFTAAKNTVAQMVSDPENQQKAWEIAKTLVSSNLTNEYKATLFNSRMREWATQMGKELSESAINALRENAVVALKGEAEADAETEKSEKEQNP